MTGRQQRLNSRETHADIRHTTGCGLPRSSLVRRSETQALCNGSGKNMDKSTEHISSANSKQKTFYKAVSYGRTRTGTCKVSLAVYFENSKGWQAEFQYNMY